MSASEYTEKLHLPIFADSDKPTWRGDVNDAHRRLESEHVSMDTRMTTADNRASTAEQLALKAQADIDKARSDIGTKADELTAASAKLKTDIESELAATKTEIQGDVASRLEAAKKETDELVSGKIKGIPVATITNAVSDLGLDPTGAQSCSQKLQEFVDANISKGGRIYFPAGDYLMTDPISFSRDTAAHYAPVWELYGAGNRGSGTDDDTDGGTEQRSAKGGSSLIFRCAGAQCMLLNTDTSFYLHDVSLDSHDSSTAPWLVRINKSIATIERVEFRGKPGQRNISCSQNGIAFGTQGNYQYGGYGSVVRDCQFDRIATCVGIYAGANAAKIDNIVVSGDCGSNAAHSAPIVLDGTGDQLRACHIEDVVAECHAYHHLLALYSQSDCIFENLQAWDMSWVLPTIFESLLYITTSAANNTFLNVWRDGWDINRVVAVNAGTIGDAYCRGNIFVGQGVMSIVGWAGGDPSGQIPGMNINCLAFTSTDGALWYHFGDGKWEKLTAK